MSNDEYAKLLKHPKWQKKRLRILERAGWRCEICRSGDRCLHVHHGYYVFGRAPWEYEDSTLYALCDLCHEPAEPLRKELNYHIGELHPISYRFVIRQLKELNAVTPGLLKKYAENRAMRLRLVK